jgi:glycosyltransferase involved in cell wall biosynthesis
MHICFVSTYHQPCGIATYTEQLAKNIAKEHQVTILGELGEKLMPKQYRDDQVAVAQVWHRQFNGGKNSVANIPKLVASMNVKPAVVHIQHEFGLFPNSDNLFDMIAQLIVQNLTVFVTLHTVTFEKAAFYRKLVDLGVGIIVHSMEAAAVVARVSETYVPFVIPHGATYTIAVRDERYILVPGFVSESKNTLEILQAYFDAREGGLTTPLRIVGMCRSEEYEAKLRAKIATYAGEDCVSLEVGFVPAEKLVALYAGAMVVVLGNNRVSPFSASGQLAQVVGVGVPVIAKNVAIYRGVDGVLYFEDVQQCALWMKTLEKNSTLRQQISVRLKLVAMERAWDKVATRHADVYTAVKETNLLTRSTVKQN